MNELIIGVDEAGRGPLFGSVYTSAVILPNNFDKSILKDSKKFSSKKKIKEVFEIIKRDCIYYSIDYSDHNNIDKYNILQATQQSMHRSINNVITKYIKDQDKIIDYDDFFKSIKICVDGNYFNNFNYFCNNKIYIINHECMIKGDALCKEISAASILAKVSRDENILEFTKNNPEYDEKYNLSKNKGYGTKQHIDGIKKYGYSEFHRKSFKIKN